MGKLLRDPQLQAAPAPTLEPKTKQDTSSTSFEDNNSPTSASYHPRPPSNDPYDRFSSESDLFDALNQHIEALDRQINSPTTVRKDDNVVDDNLPQPDLE